MILPLYGMTLNKQNMPELYVIKKFNVKAETLQSYEGMVEVLNKHLHLNKKVNEECYIICFMSDLTPICICEISKGIQTHTYVSNATIGKFLLLSGAYQFVLFHNHPCYSLDISADDYTMTYNVRNLGTLLDIRFLDSIIISMNGWKMILNSNT